MKLKNILLPLTAFMTFTAASAQETETGTVKRISINEIQVSVGFGPQRISSATLDDFRKLAPNSELLNNDFTGFSDNGGHSFTDNSMFSILLGIKFRNKDKTAYRTNPQLRVGISYFSTTSVAGGLFKQEKKPFDTLTSAQTAQAVYIDAVTTTNYNMNYSSEQLRLDASLIFSTNPQARWSLYGGVGITAGMSINSTTEIEFSVWQTRESAYSEVGYSVTNSRPISSSGSYESFVNTINYGFSAYAPLGVNFRMGKKREFWKRLNLFYEFRPGVDITSIPTLRLITNPIVQHVFGVKVRWN